ncbi:similar to Saccharomyces cerevisiae YHR177W Putative protein of unknown function [Maudiozyma barnettii]|uniref:Uncharacterized protein n=1 Tax=Maudiozyma barnettii TaxID=61262 RepID=A0A8H2ZJX2_9SACH|nr:uncharacterized protein KABA2_09S03432 [Kazachstania barnettii]CAB4256383.1 similar to Saccharomyces cerevisiae YHR177W Putative protein of unknown function [Kazachstania barnettii]CAD1784992.1 similar to Saccharomyces cerevisiae YHR177W Putative protein of unknown function [Kazachstania barnettii]
MDIEPTFRGYIQNELDALLIFQAVLDSRLNHVPRRPYEIERPYLIISGNIFVFIEEVSGIKRWTDGITWSPSRISGKFLIYKELDRSYNNTSMFPQSSHINRHPHQMIPQTQSQQQHPQTQSLVSGNGNPYPQSNYPIQQFSKYTGFVKKTISMKLQTNDKEKVQQHFHIVSYYLEDDINFHRLKRPSESPFFNDIKPSKELIQALDSSNLGAINGSTIPSSTNNQQIYPYINERKPISEEISVPTNQNPTYHQQLYGAPQTQMWNPQNNNSNNNTNGNNTPINNNSSNNINTNNSGGSDNNSNVRLAFPPGMPNPNTLYPMPYGQQQQIGQNRMMVNNPYQVYYAAIPPSMGVSHIQKFPISLNQQIASDVNNVNNNNNNNNSNHSNNNNDNNINHHNNNTNNSNNSNNDGNVNINNNGMYQQNMDHSQQQQQQQQQPYPINLVPSANNENNIHTQQFYPPLTTNHVQGYPTYYGQGPVLPNNETIYGNNDVNSEKLRNSYLADNSNTSTNNTNNRADPMNIPVITTARLNNTLTGQTVTDSPYESPLVPLTHKAINTTNNAVPSSIASSSFHRNQRQQQQQRHPGGPYV